MSGPSFEVFSDGCPTVSVKLKALWGVFRVLVPGILKGESIVWARYYPPRPDERGRCVSVIQCRRGHEIHRIQQSIAMHAADIRAVWSEPR
jgi:hypothetical protein